MACRECLTGDALCNEGQRLRGEWITRRNAWRDHMELFFGPSSHFVALSRYRAIAPCDEGRRLYSAWATSANAYMDHYRGGFSASEIDRMEKVIGRRKADIDNRRSQWNSHQRNSTSGIQ